MLEFTSEDDLKTFDGWLKYQGIDAALSSVQELENWRRVYQETRERSATGPIGRMKLRLVRGEHRYAVAVRDGSHLYLTLWVRRSLKGEFFVFLPRAD